MNSSFTIFHQSCQCIESVHFLLKVVVNGNPEPSLSFIIHMQFLLCNKLDQIIISEPNHSIDIKSAIILEVAMLLCA